MSVMQPPHGKAMPGAAKPVRSAPHACAHPASAVAAGHATGQGLSPALTLLLAVGTGLSVANLYYAQPMLGVLSSDLGASAREVGLLPTLTQLGYAAGIAFLAPLGDRYDRRRHRRHRHVDVRVDKRHRHGHDRRHDRYDRRWERRHRHDRYDRRWDRRHRHRFEIPRYLRKHHVRHYNDYFDGYVYFRPHRHRHAVYVFPVYIDGYWSWRPHYYCEGDLFHGHGSVGYDGRRFSFRLGF